MVELTLRDEVEELFKWAISRTANQPELVTFHNLLQSCHERLHQPMRVAIVGLIKAGKSTLMNALLGETVVATGAVEATFNVNWIKYGQNPALKVHFRDGRSPESKSFNDLADLTLRATENRDYLLNIKYIEVFYPNLILQTFNLIDTPGLKSFYEDDSQNTIDFLQLHGQELTQVTQAEASNADAILYLFSQSLGSDETAIVEQFQGASAGSATPINAIGVLTKVDFYWSDPKVTDPIETARRVTQRLNEHPRVRPLLYTIYPVCQLLALGARTLKPEEFVILQQLAEIPEERFDRLIRNVSRFTEKEYPDVLVPPIQRQQVLARLGQYGIWLAYSLIRSGINNQEQLVRELVQKSGIEELSSLVISHFGNRAFLIKLGTGLRQIAVASFQQYQQLQGIPQQIVGEISGKFEALQEREHSFKELEVLRSYYEGKLNFDAEEVQQLLQVTGEYGKSCGERLGLNEGATIPTMLSVASKLVSYWHQRGDDYMAGDRQTVAAAKVIARSYERILYRVQKAKEYLYM
jgi:GTPase SAR1 family protein